MAEQSQPYELAPRPGMTASQRKEELDSARFVAVRNLAYVQYKKPDGQPLMTYQETLTDREAVKLTIINFELANGWLVNDGGAAGQPAPAPQMPAPAAAPAPQMMAPQPTPMPQMGVPGGMQPAAPMYGAPPGMPQMAPATAAQAASVGLPAQPQPEAPSATGRKRRGAAPAQPPAGAPMMPGVQPGPVMPGPGMTPQGQPAPTGVQFNPIPGPAPAAFQQVPAPAGPAPAALPVAGPTPSADLGPLLARLEAIGAELGRGLTAISKDVEEVRKGLAAVRSDTHLSLGALHHIHATSPALAPNLVNEKVQTLDQFKAFLTKYVGNPT